MRGNGNSNTRCTLLTDCVGTYVGTSTYLISVGFWNRRFLWRAKSLSLERTRRIPGHLPQSKRWIRKTSKKGSRLKIKSANK